MAAIKAYREGKLPFPDGAINRPTGLGATSHQRNNKVFGRDQSSLPSSRSTFCMLKDSKKSAATGGWGFAQFKDGKPAEEGHKNLFPCH